MDRNVTDFVFVKPCPQSLSARRAWIEILNGATLRLWACVALRKESVDRNMSTIDVLAVSAVALRKESVDRNTSIDNLTQGVFKSLSARRAWIEIYIIKVTVNTPAVALRKESVDRNMESSRAANCQHRRSPQGERG